MDDGIVFEHISKEFNGRNVLKNVSFSIKKGEFFSLLGPSGCGKTTLLRILAGFEQPEKGRILLNGQDITNLPPNKRPINTVFQNYALFPHLSIRENIAFGLRIAKKPEAEIRREVKRMLALIQMEEHADKMPDQISGGQKQRVAIARALVNHPQILLLDEPLAALDLKLRQKMLLDLDRIHDEVGITFIFVTHDQTEAMAVSDRIAVFNQGHLEQIGTPPEIYETPTSTFVADFIGDTNYFDGTIKTTNYPEYIQLTVDDFPAITCFKDKQLTDGELVRLTVRPEKIYISSERPPQKALMNVFQGVVEDVVYKGDHTHFGVKVAGKMISVTQQHHHFLLDESPIKWEDTVWIGWHANDGFMLGRRQDVEARDEK